MSLISTDSISRVNLDQFLDKIPVISTVNNLINMAQKIIHRNEEVSKKSHYYRYLSLKSYSRCIVLCIPLFGQLAVYIYRLIRKRTSQELYRKMDKRKEWGNETSKNLEILEQANDLGKNCAAVRLATCYEHGLGVEKNRNKAFTLYQRAADKGNLAGLLNVMFHDDSEYLKTYKDDKEGLLKILMKQTDCKNISSLQSEVQFHLMGIFNDLIKFNQKTKAIFFPFADYKPLCRKVVRICEIVDDESIVESTCPILNNIRDTKKHATAFLA